MKIDLFDYYLPEELIAQSPADRRDNSRLLVVNKKNQTHEDKVFHDIKNYLRKGDVLVINNTKVLPARLIGIKQITGAHCEVLILKSIEKDVWECLVKPAKSIKIGTKISFGDDDLIAECINVFDEGIRHMKFEYKGLFIEALERIGKMPLPPYIKKQLIPNDRYQTVYAKNIGSAAAPTAGFHFTKELLEEIKEMGVEIDEVTLNIGLGTFRPVKVDDTDNHIMHSEEYEILPETADKLNKAKAEGRRIIAVGTTAVRSLEANYSKYGCFKPTKESTKIFITPGYTFQAIDCLITNFHLPKSTLIMLVSAFMGREFTLDTYNYAVQEQYHFFSFGDAMFIYEK